MPLGEKNNFNWPWEMVRSIRSMFGGGCQSELSWRCVRRAIAVSITCRRNMPGQDGLQGEFGLEEE